MSYRGSLRVGHITEILECFGGFSRDQDLSTRFK
jgi:hypothetical protein